MGASGNNSTNNGLSIQTVLYQFGFLLTGIFTTLGVQWLFYRGAATSMSLFPQLSTYTGMLLVGLFIPVLLKRKRQMALHYQKVISTEQEEDDRVDIFKNYSIRSNDLSKTTTSSSATATVEVQQQIAFGKDDEEDSLKLPARAFMGEEGPIPHIAIIKLASLEIIASFALTIGFSIIGSGMYQVIYSSVVIWCAILTWLLMGRALTKIQWVAIMGTSVGLTVSSLDSIRGSSLRADDFATNTEDTSIVLNNSLFNGTLMTLGGTFISACIYVFADNILSKSKTQPLPARVCCWMGVYTSIFAWLWVSIYTLPQFHDMIHIDKDTSTISVVLVYLIVTIANALHSWCYYELIERTGNVATGILQSLRAILVYGISHLWYCQEDSAQCLTTSKGLGSLIVISCVLLFTLGKK